MTIVSAFRTFALCLLPFALIWEGPLAPAPPHLEFRVVFASHQHLASQLDEAGREGYGCLLVVRNEGASGAPGVVIWLARESGGTPKPSEYRVFTGAADLAVPLEKAGGDGFRLCGLVLSEAPPVTTVVAAMRNWMVVAEQGGAGTAVAREVAVNSDPGPSGLQRKLNERGQQGFQVDLLWKEGNDYVAMSSRSSAGAPAPRAYAVAANPLANVHSLSRLYLADFPYLQDRLIVSDTSVSASADVVEDALPALGAFPDRAALGLLASHLARNQGFVPAAARISRGPNGQWRLTTVVVKR